MNATLPLLLAESRVESLSEGFRSHGGTGRDEVLLGLLMFVAVVAGLWAISRIMGLRRRRRGYNNPWQLFRELCKAHHLTWSDGWLLRRIAQHQGLRDPARLFLEVELWEEQKLGASFALEFAHLRALRGRLFGTTAPSAQSPPSPPAARRPQQAPAASPLFQRVAAPTLDLPPWTESSSVDV